MAPPEQQTIDQQATAQQATRRQTATRLDGLDFRQLRALQAVVEHGTFGRAAHVLGFTQSAISQQIASLERMVDERLFDRPGGPRPVALTPAGRLVLKHAERTLAHVELLERDLAGFKSGTVGRIDVSVFQSVAVKVLPAVVGRLRKEVDADVRPVETNEDAVTISRLQHGEVDVGFVATQVRMTSPFEFVEVVSDPFVVVTPRDYTDKHYVDVSALADVPLIGQPVSDTCQLRIDASLVEAGVMPEYVFRTSDNAALQSMVREGMGLAVMPLLGVDVSDPAVRVCRLEPAFPPRRIGLIFREDAPPMVKRFVEIAIEVCREAVEAMASDTDIA